MCIQHFFPSTDSGFSAIVCSIIQKASNALEVLREVLDAVDSQNPEVHKSVVFSLFCIFPWIYLDRHILLIVCKCCHTEVLAVKFLQGFHIQFLSGLEIF